MAKKTETNGVEQPTSDVTWLSMEEASKRAGKAQATIRSALHKHPIFADGSGYQELKPVLILPDGTQKPGSGRGNLIVRSDLLDQWVEASGERQPNRASGTVYRVTLSGVPMSAEMVSGVQAAVAGIAEGQPLYEAVAALLDPFDVDLRRAFAGRNKPKNESNGTDDSTTERESFDSTIHTGDAAHSDQFEFELVEG